MRHSYFYWILGDWKHGFILRIGNLVIDVDWLCYRNGDNDRLIKIGWYPY